MDFITRLPASRRVDSVYNTVLVIINRFTKVTRYIPYKKIINTKQLTKLIIDIIVKDFSLPSGIILDRGLVFISKFWLTLY